MRIIALSSVNNFFVKHPKCEQALKSWIQEMQNGKWDSPQQLKMKFKSASVLNGKRIVFNINGNKYRLIVDIEFRLGIIFIVWFGPHNEYDLINAKTISYDKAHKDRK